MQVTDECILSGRPPYILLQYETLADKRIVVAIDSWEADSLYPAGHYTRTLGPIGDRDTETEVCWLCTALWKMQATQPVQRSTAGYQPADRAAVH